jgi:hypothetical protein
MTTERTDTTTTTPRADTAETVHSHEHGDHVHTHAHPGGDEPHSHAAVPGGEPHGGQRATSHEVGNGAGDGHHTLFRSNEVDGLHQRWDSIQASFIDAPREAVAEADRLVSDLTDRITDRFGSERSSLEERWNRGEDVSTEHLRQSLQRYRGFFDRLLRL